MNILTFDIEEWFHLLDSEATRSETAWGTYEVRIHENVERLLRVLKDTDTQATFFILGWVAKTYPEVVRRIAERYQVGYHSLDHRLVWQQSPAAFRADLETGVKMIEDISGKKVECFRAPGFSLRESEGWAFEILAGQGIRYDCSVFPVRQSFGGMPSYPKAAPGIIEHGGVRIREFPVGFRSFAGMRFVFSGGGYFRFCPYRVLRRWSARSPEYLMAYLHPRDLDPGQPRLKGLPPLHGFSCYKGLQDAERKLRQWLTDFAFMDVAAAAEQVDWEHTPVVRL